MALALFALAGVLASAPTARAEARIVGLACEIGGGRTRVLVPRAEEDASDDELTCRAELTGLAPTTAELAGELRIEGPAGVRVVAMGMFEASGADRPRLEGLVVPHSTWAGAISWKDPRRPKLRLELRVYRKRAAAPRRAWRLVASATLELGPQSRRR